MDKFEEVLKVIGQTISEMAQENPDEQVKNAQKGLQIWAINVHRLRQSKEFLEAATLAAKGLIGTAKGILDTVHGFKGIFAAAEKLPPVDSSTLKDDTYV